MTTERWFKNSEWRVQDLNVNHNKEEKLFPPAELAETPLSEGHSEDDGFEEFTEEVDLNEAQESIESVESPISNSIPANKRGRKPNSEKHGA